MPGFNSTMYISNDFRELIQRGNKYEDYVLEIMNLSRSIFPNRYYKINEQSNNEPDFKECGSERKAVCILVEIVLALEFELKIGLFPAYY